ncbi:MAG TPA: YdbC family protein [Caldilineaceae bacterium]|nr:YdbC family protein [Caldilineaceae bacterium]
MTLVKWIVCQVPTNLRDAFDEAQQQWQRLATAAGFLGQIGGWDQNDSTQGCILALWQDWAAYDQFMAQLHDEIVDQSDQRRTYTAIQVTMAEMRFPMPGAASNVGAALAAARILRVADCRVHNAQVDHFVTVQQQVWLPAMAASNGMLGGCFSQCTKEADHYLVTTLWDTMANHAHYATHRVPALRAQANVASDLAALTGYVVALEPQWSMLPDRR